MQVSKKATRQIAVEVADAISSLDIGQVAREAVAEAVGDALLSTPAARQMFMTRELFVGIASDPLVPCSGYDDLPCPDGRRIRVAMHLSTAPDGRSAAWQEDAPKVWCVSCGARHFNPDYPRNERNET